MSKYTFEAQDPYLEHLFGLGYKKERKNHKYIAKIKTDKGIRYFYTKSDLQAYYARQKAKDKLGFDERDRRNKARSEYEKISQERKQRIKEDNDMRYTDQSPESKTANQNEIERLRIAEQEAKQRLDYSQAEYSKTALGKFDNLIQAVKKYGKKKLSSITSATVKKLGQLYSKGSTPFKLLANTLVNHNVTEYSVRKSILPRSEKSIIDRLSGGDMTNGSCMSLVMAYAGNKAGYDVVDYRGGDSQAIFSNREVIEAVARLSDVDSRISEYDGEKKSCLDSAMDLIGDVISNESGKEYLLVTGCHAAVIRQGDAGIEYLEMQSGSKAYPNGWHTLTMSSFIERFGIDYAPPAASSILIDVASLGQSEEFLSLLSYINTPAPKQQKGRQGHVK